MTKLLSSVAILALNLAGLFVLAQFVMPIGGLV